MGIENLIHLKGATYLIPGPTNLGLFVEEGDVTLIDSGNDKESGRRINKILKENGWTLKTIINTHSNADHIGGNDYLQRMTDCQIWAPVIESVFIEHPELEGSLLWGGYPVKEMRSKFFMAKPSKVTNRIAEGQVCLNDHFTLFPLAGHFFDMVGVMTGDRVFFLGDCMFGEDILAKYRIPFIYDVAAYKRTITSVREVDADVYVLSHGQATDTIGPIADLNEAIVAQVEECLERMLVDKLGGDDILKKVCDHFAITLDYGQYALVGSTVRSFLAYLYNEGRLGYGFLDNRLCWYRL